MTLPLIAFLGDPADLTLAPGDTLVLHTGPVPTVAGAIALTYDGTPGSLTFDPAAVGNPSTLTARRLVTASAHDVIPGASSDGRSLPVGGAATPASAPHAGAATTPGALHAGPAT